MASLLKFCKISTKIRANNCGFMYNVVRHSSVNRDYAPGPYPTTEEEMAKAAEKYGLPRADYKPRPDDGNGHGDYPDLPGIPAVSKDPYYPYDHPELKRNFNEPMPITFSLFTEDRMTDDTKLRYPLYIYWLTFLGVMAGFFAIHIVAEKYKHVQPLVRKQVPYTGVTHYTFEPLD